MKSRSRKRSSRTRKTIRGGKYIGEGSYGCTFTDPPLKCTTNATRRNSNQLTKLMDPYFADEEIQKSNLFRTIDPSEKYFITANHSCSLNASNIKPENQLDKCKLITNVSSPKSLLFYKFGGYNLINLHPLQSGLYTYMFKSVVNLFDGLQLAHDNHIIHHDIKAENIVSGPSSTGTSLYTRFIDFGFAHKFPITDQDEMDILTDEVKNTYVYWPFDIRFLNGDNFVRANNPAYKGHFEIEYKRWHKKFKETYGDFAPLFFDIHDNPRYAFNDYYTNIISSFSTRPAVYTDEAILLAADRYAIGLVFLELLRYLQYEIVWTPDGKYNFQINNTNKLPGNKGYVLMLETYGISHDIAEWHKEVVQHIASPILQICMGLCMYNPLKRMSIVDAKQIYVTNVLPHIDRLLDQSLVYNGLSAIKKIKGFLPPEPSLVLPPQPPVIRGAVPVVAPSSVRASPYPKPVLPKSRRNRRTV